MKSLLIKSRKNRKGLSGAVTALILVIASVLIALIVVAFAFGFLSFGGAPTVQQSGAAYITNGGKDLSVVLTSTGNAVIDSVSVNGALESTGITLSAGTTSLNIALPTGATLNPGGTYTVTLGLSDGDSVAISATYQ
ncbi:DUF973 family protein [Sulfuracidifex tepidarius]|uniref:Archaeal Type IV pilin N-terminal domain-containing protein n=1 Tax=Sulfuracidifex tepidarius TaxID=1294262 RepID=A0A510DZK3_9CREN|nr:DUF973 family protein [Sulfuracidifex tepidarius]BBG25599.1 hypothetical protein IC007_0104 [Sulfuracidifex tepidarius]